MGVSQLDPHRDSGNQAPCGNRDAPRCPNAKASVSGGDPGREPGTCSVRAALGGRTCCSGFRTPATAKPATDRPLDVYGDSTILGAVAGAGRAHRCPARPRGPWRL